MPLGDRLGLASLVATLFALAAFYLWPNRKVIGWIALALVLALAAAWASAEFSDPIRNALGTETRRSIAIAELVAAALLAGTALLTYYLTSIPIQLAHDDRPVLLATINGSAGGSITPAPEVRGMMFLLISGEAYNTGGEHVLGIDARYVLGSASGVWASGSSGTFDLTPSNSPEFTSFTSWLIQAGDEEALSVAGILPRTQTPPPGNAEAVNDIETPRVK